MVLGSFLSNAPFFVINEFSLLYFILIHSIVVAHFLSSTTSLPSFLLLYFILVHSIVVAQFLSSTASLLFTPLLLLTFVTNYLCDISC